MVRTSQVTSAEEPDGGNLHVRIWRGAGLRKRLGLLNNPPVSAPWRPASKAGAWGRRCLIGGVLAVLGVAISQWLAGGCLLWSLHRPTHLATPLTVARYAVYYGH